MAALQPGARRARARALLSLAIGFLLLSACTPTGRATSALANADASAGGSPTAGATAPALLNSPRTPEPAGVPTIGTSSTAAATAALPHAAATASPLAIGTVVATRGTRPTVSPAAGRPTSSAQLHATAATVRTVANRSAWSGDRLFLQAGTTAAVAVTAPSSADLGHLPTISVNGLSAPTAALLADGDTAVTVTVPPAASGRYLLVARWPDGQQGNLHLHVEATVPLATGLGQPDDLTIAPDGSVLYTDLNTNSVDQLLADGTRRTLISGLSVPEGLAVTGANRLLFADQGTNRVFQWTAPGSLRLLLQLPPVRGVDGIDGLGVAVIDGVLTALLPDSPNGRLLLLGLNGGTPTAIGGGWRRPTDAIVHAGQLYLVDEYGSRLWHGLVHGTLQPIGPAMSYPDDVVVNANGVAFVNDLGSGTTGGRIERIDPNGRGSAVLTGLNDPQGLDLDGAGNLILTEAGNGRVAADVQSCLPILLGGANVKLTVGGPPRALGLATDCAAGRPSFTLAPGALWPAAAATTWPTGRGTTLALGNGARASLIAGKGTALLLLQPPAHGSSGTATLSLQLHVGPQTVARQIVVTVAG